MDTRFEAVVVGAGPAGSTAAYHLARAGVRVLLLEREPLPRFKPCGGGLTAKTLREIRFDLGPLVEDVCSGFEVTFRQGGRFVRRYPEPLVYMVMRHRFDRYLAEQAESAGAVLMDGTRVTGVVPNGSRVEVRTEGGVFQAQAAVGADGANGIVAGSVGLGKDLRHAVAWESELSPGYTALRRWRGLVGVDLGTAGAGGCGWVFPKGGNLSVGIAAHAPSFKGIRAYYDGFAARTGLGTMPVIHGRGHRLPIRPPGSRIRRGRVLLAGDAAGMVDAFTGEGIYWAVRSGRLAAASVLDLLGGLEPDLSGYERRVDEELMPELLAAQRWLNLYLWAPRLCYLLLRHSERFWRAVCLILRGERTYQDLAGSLGPLRGLVSLLPPVGESSAGIRRAAARGVTGRSTARAA